MINSVKWLKNNPSIPFILQEVITDRD